MLYFITLSPHEELLQYIIDEDTLIKYIPESILAHALWELTCYGFCLKICQGFLKAGNCSGSIRRTENPRYGIVTSYITGGKNGVGLNFAGNAGRTVIRFEFDAVHSFLIHIPSLWGTHIHLPSQPITDSSTGSAIADYIKFLIGGWTYEAIFESSY